jgi:hypothetical protein
MTTTTTTTYIVLVGRRATRTGTRALQSATYVASGGINDYECALLTKQPTLFIIRDPLFANSIYTYMYVFWNSIQRGKNWSWSCTFIGTRNKSSATLPALDFLCLDQTLPRVDESIDHKEVGQSSVIPRDAVFVTFPSLASMTLVVSSYALETLPRERYKEPMNMNLIRWRCVVRGYVPI